MKFRTILSQSLAACAIALCGVLPAGADDIEVVEIPVTACVPVGTVSSLTGLANAVGPGGTRSLACGDVICGNDTITTAAGGSAGVLIGDVLAQIGNDSTAQLGLTPAGTADVQLANGAVRVIDPSTAGAPARLVAGGAAARVAGNDAEGHVLREKAGSYALLCEWDEPLEVARGGQSATAAPGECVVAKGSEPLYTAPGHPERIAALTDTCDPGFDVAANLDPLPPVAGGPPEGPPVPNPPLFPPPSPCDQPGVGCLPPVMVMEQEPTDSPFPGDGNEDGTTPTL